MADRIDAAPVIRTTEFQIVKDPITGLTVRQFGLCGPNSSASALGSALGHQVTTQQTYTYMRNNGLCDQNGASTMSGNVACCQAFGAVVVDTLGYSDSLVWSDILAFIRRNAGINPIVYETSKGQAQVDYISGSGENAVNLQFHFPMMAGYHEGGASDYFGGQVLPEGVIVCDGCNFEGGNWNSNNFNAADVKQFYIMTVIEAAALVGLFALKGRDVMLTIDQVSGYYAVNSDGTWHCKQTGMTIRGGILQEYLSFVGSGSLNGFSDMGLPLTNEIAIGKPYSNGIQPVIQVFERGAFMYDPQLTVDDPPGTAANTIYKANYTHPNVQAALATVFPSFAASAPSIAFGTVIETPGTGVLTLAIPYTLK